MSTAAQLEQLIEAKITAAISVVITDRTVVGFWTASAAGEPKEINGSSVSVMVSPRETEEYESDIITLHADIRLVGAQEDDACCERFPTAFQNLMSVFQGWDTDDDVLSAAMDVSGVFRCDALLLSNGGAPGWDDGGKYWYVDIGLDIKGCIVSG